MQEISVRNIIEYLHIISTIAERYSCRKTDLLFRGVAHYDHGLIPGVYRKHLAETDQGPQYRPNFINVPEIIILNHFIKHAMNIVDNIDKDDLLTWLTYAQHFGAPTRLLDFSANPLISLYFCCRSAYEQDGGVCVLYENNYVRSMRYNEGRRRSKGEILNEIMDHIRNPESVCTPYPVTFIPNFIDSRMEAQASRFLVWGCNPSSFDEIAEEHGNLLDYDPNAFFCKIRIDGASKRELLRELSFLGVNDMKLFPDLDGIGKYVTEYYLNS